MSAIVVFGSRYGSTKSYAEEFVRRHSLDAISFDEVSDLSNYDTIIYFGGLYAANVYGLKKTMKLIQSDQRLIIVTVGLNDPDIPKNAEYTEKNIRQILPNPLNDNAEIYQLRGAIDYKNLKPLHRIMMYFIYLKAKSDDTEESRQMVDTYGDMLSFVDFSTLDKIQY
ncbi:hypothetical protein HYO62_08230 [Aerococcaceae bacterium DSM 111022]|nr:hypothetical protein [Aerococcaceae bacterium DSM 111022]